MTSSSSSRLFSLHVLLLALTLFSWGLLFLSVALPGQHAFRREWGMGGHSPNRKTMEQRQAEKEAQKKASKNSCSECWSVLRGAGHYRNETNLPPSSVEDADLFYLFTLSSTLTSLRIRLRMAKKVAGKKRKEIEEIECKVEQLHRKVKFFWDKRKPSNGNKKLSTLDTASRSRSNIELSLMNILNKIFVPSKSSGNQKASLNPVPFPEVSVIVDGRDGNNEILLNSYTNVSTELMFHVGVDVSSPLLQKRYPKTRVYEVPKNASRGAVYNALLRHVVSPYTLVASDLRYLDRDCKLDKLISLLREGDVWAVGGGTLSTENEWESSCLQSTYKNFRAKFYRKSVAWLSGCSICSGLAGPFLALTPVLQSLEWDQRLDKKAVILDIFLRSFHYLHLSTTSCPDALFPTWTTFEPLPREEVVPLANVHRLKEIHFPRAPPVILKCQEMVDVCREPGEMVSPCCLMELASMVKFFLSTCEAHGLFCELQEGSLLGAVKFRDILPWEKDADITFHTANFSAIRELAPIFKKAGYVLKLTDNRWCCVNGSEAGGEGKLIGGHWMAELYSQHAMDTEEARIHHEVPTKVELHGGWVRSPTNPGEYVRNRYGNNIYRHAQHWIDLGKPSGWEEYPTDGFTPCGTPGHHACLDLNPSDGVTQFELPRA